MVLPDGVPDLGFASDLVADWVLGSWRFVLDVGSDPVEVLTDRLEPGWVVDVFPPGRLPAVSPPSVPVSYQPSFAHVAARQRAELAASLREFSDAEFGRRFCSWPPLPASA